MKLSSILAFAALAVAVPTGVDELLLKIREDSRQHIGYRIVSKEEADAINDNDYKAVQSKGSQGRQLGAGVYISPAYQDIDYKKLAPGEIDNGPKLWDCAVTIDKATWDGFQKAWIPRLYDFSEEEAQCKPLRLWSMRKEFVNNRNKFLGVLDASFDYTNMLLFSYVDGYPGKLQALIPPAIVDQGVFYLKPCAERDTDANAKIGQLGTVDWGVSNIAGFGEGYETAP